MRDAHARALLAAVVMTSLSACSVFGKPTEAFEQGAKPTYARRTSTQEQLQSLPPPAVRVAVAVYGFSDQTGQFKPSNTVQTLSRAVTQGATSILVASLEDAGARSWFTVIERERLDNVLKERQIIREMRQRYLGEDQINTQALPPLLFAGVLLEGGVISFDTNTVTGGLGARYLGIGANTEYQQDTVTVYLRVVSVKTGEVLTSVSARKTIASYAIQANAFRFVGFRELLEAETGITYNEPGQLALRQAIEKAVHALVLEGAALRIWAFRDPASAQALIEAHRREKLGLDPGEALPVTQASFQDSAPANGNQVTGYPPKVAAPPAPANVPAPSSGPKAPREVIRIDGSEYTPAATAEGDDIDWSKKVVIGGREWVRVLPNKDAGPSKPAEKTVPK
jgi:curli production assembly/transport component CsgG